MTRERFEPTPEERRVAGWALALHGGAGVAEHHRLPPGEQAAYRAGLRSALDRGAAVLDAGGTALDAVQATVQVLEADPLFNAGHGAVFTADGRVELDAAIMDGATLRAGSIAGVSCTRHPVALARAVMERSAHVMLVGAGAEDFAASQGLEPAGVADLFTEARWQALLLELGRLGLPPPPRPRGVPAPPPAPIAMAAVDDRHYGTVGAVARDLRGHLAAATSTGGLSAKARGRVGDSPIIGAGTYARDGACAVSGTGSGEHFIRLGVAHEMSALVRHGGMSLQAAADALIRQQLTALGGEGGVVAVGAHGEIAWSFNTPVMFRASARLGGAPRVAIFESES